MKSDVAYDLLIIGGGISACVFASRFLKNNITKKVGLIEIMMFYLYQDRIRKKTLIH